MKVAFTLPEVFPVPPTAAPSLGKISKLGEWVKLNSTSAAPCSTGGMKVVTLWASAGLWETFVAGVVGLQARLDQCVVVVMVVVLAFIVGFVFHKESGVAWVVTEENFLLLSGLTDFGCPVVILDKAQ